MTVGVKTEGMTLETCRCGVPLHQFWVWEDVNGTMHASHFSPSQGAVRSLYAVTTRDALLPLAMDPRVPKHDVHDLDNPGRVWEGRCSASLQVAG
jgi:hypothetical protein